MTNKRKKKAKSITSKTGVPYQKAAEQLAQNLNTVSLKDVAPPEYWWKGQRSSAKWDEMEKVAIATQFSLADNKEASPLDAELIGLTDAASAPLSLEALQSLHSRP